MMFERGDLLPVPFTDRSVGRIPDCAIGRAFARPDGSIQATIAGINFNAVVDNFLVKKPKK